MKNAATIARFGDKRTYLYGEKEVDQDIHKSVDLASLAGSNVPVANNGVVVFCSTLGVYGNTVVVDHGQGLSSIYSHLSDIHVDLGKTVLKGDVIGITGSTGLAGGDYLEFAMMVHGTFVNPMEWWDSKWLEENILAKLNSH